MQAHLPLFMTALSSRSERYSCETMSTIPHVKLTDPIPPCDLLGLSVPGEMSE